MFFKGSRYENVETAKYVDENGRTYIYKKIRFITDTPAFFEYTTTQGERLDHISYKFHNDSTKFWIICDANKEMDPEDLEIPGRRMLIPRLKF